MKKLIFYCTFAFTLLVAWSIKGNNKKGTLKLNLHEKGCFVGIDELLDKIDNPIVESVK